MTEDDGWKTKDRTVDIRQKTKMGRIRRNNHWTWDEMRALWTGISDKINTYHLIE